LEAAWAAAPVARHGHGLGRNGRALVVDVQEHFAIHSSRCDANGRCRRPVREGVHDQIGDGLGEAIEVPAAPAVPHRRSNSFLKSMFPTTASPQCRLTISSSLILAALSPEL